MSLLLPVTTSRCELEYSIHGTDKSLNLCSTPHYGTCAWPCAECPPRHWREVSEIFGKSLSAEGIVRHTQFHPRMMIVSVVMSVVYRTAGHPYMSACKDGSCTNRRESRGGEGPFIGKSRLELCCDCCCSATNATA